MFLHWNPSSFCVLWDSPKGGANNLGAIGFAWQACLRQHGFWSGQSATPTLPSMQRLQHHVHWHKGGRPPWHHPALCATCPWWVPAYSACLGGHLRGWWLCHYWCDPNSISSLFWGLGNSRFVLYPLSQTSHGAEAGSLGNQNVLNIWSLNTFKLCSFRNLLNERCFLQQRVLSHVEVSESGSIRNYHSW